MKRAREEVKPPDPKTQFWSPAVQSLSEHTWLPLPETSAPSSATSKILSDSWFSVRETTTSVPVAPLGLDFERKTPSAKRPRYKKQPPNSDGKKPPKPRKPKPLPPTSIFRKRLRPSQPENIKLKHWLSAVRWTYNSCVALVNSGTSGASPPELRPRCVSQEALRAAGKRKYLDVPSDIRDFAVRDFVSAYAIQLGLQEAGRKDKFKMKFRSLQDPQLSLTIPSRLWNKVGKAGRPSNNCCSWLKNIRCKEGLPATLANDTRLVRTRQGLWYICIGSRPEPSTPEQPRHQVVALDPGVRTFMTLFDPQGRVLEVGANGSGRFNRYRRLIQHVSTSIEIVADPDNGYLGRGVRRRKLKRMRAIQQRWRDKMRNLVDECHKKLCKYLCESYDVILLPVFKTSRMVNGSRRKGTSSHLHGSTKRDMHAWSHFRFRQRLEQKARQYTGLRPVQIRWVSEAYTSRTCTRCGHVRDKYSDKIFKCPSCRIEMDRDVLGARNVFLRNAA